MCVRSLPPYEALLVDQVAPDSVVVAPVRLYELTVGARKACRAGACSRMPPMKLYAVSEKPRPCASPPEPGKSASPCPSQRDRWKCSPLPVRLVNGLGMNVA